MDRNQVIGLVLLAAILIGYQFYTAPTQEQIAAEQARKDSIALVEQNKAKPETDDLPEATAAAADGLVENQVSDSLQQVKDSLRLLNDKNAFGPFYTALSGEEKTTVLENDLVKIDLSSKGGSVKRVELKDFQTYDSLPLYVVPESNEFSLNFYSENKLIETSDLFFKEVAKSDTQLTYWLETSQPGQYIEFDYRLRPGSYLVDYKVNVVGLDAIADDGFGVNWSMSATQKEKNIETERNTTTVFWRYWNDEESEINELSETGFETEPIDATTQWVSFKQQFFSAAIIAPGKGFSKIDGEVSTTESEEANVTKKLAAEFSIVFDDPANASFPMQFYFGPNNYNILSDLDYELEEQINLGWAIFGWVNQFMVIPLFNFLEGLGIFNYGIIILILTILIKTLLFPLTWKNYVSSARMKALKPEIEEISKKFGEDDMMKKQQATMALYKEAGVNPMAGCIPMIIQMPILYAMFRFFPSSIELRQESFLWADDLSTYDSIAQLPFEIPFYGDHISLFTILMAISTFFYTRYNMSMTPTGGGPQAQQMKIIMYFMPVMLLFFFNSYSSGLSYYYLMANVMSIVQQLAIKKWFIDEEKIRVKIEAYKKRPKAKKKKGGFQKRLEEMQRKQQEQQRNRRK